jgi:hypothetical protein
MEVSDFEELVKQLDGHDDLWGAYVYTLGREGFIPGRSVWHFHCTGTGVGLQVVRRPLVAFGRLLCLYYLMEAPHHFTVRSARPS